MSDLEQAKRRDRKVYITDIAIEKVPYIEYHGYDEDKCKIMQELAKNVLLLSKEENDSNEVAITCDLGIENPLEQFGISPDSPIMEQYLSALSFLAKGSEVGLYYR